MAFKGIDMGLALILVTMLLGRATAQSSCTSTLTSLAPCLNYVTGSSSNPSSSCCSQLSNVVQSSPQCLCSLLNGGGSTLGITINQTLALSLPGACNVKTPPVSRCQSANGPTTSSISTPPASSPAETPGDANTPESAITPSASDFPSGEGSKTVLSTNSNTYIGRKQHQIAPSLCVLPHFRYIMCFKSRQGLSLLRWASLSSIPSLETVAS